MPRQVVAYFDYLCPFAWRGAEVAEFAAAGLDLSFDWRHFSLVQANSKEPDFQIWNEKLSPEDPSGNGGLLPFLASSAARRQGCAVYDAFRLELLRARHRDHLPFTTGTIMTVAVRVGMDAERFESDLRDPELRTQLAQEHYQARKLYVFGTPTFHFCDTGDVSYFRIRELPGSRDEAVALFERFHSLLADYPYLETVKRPRNNGN